jgi:hypothetical protein
MSIVPLVNEENRLQQCITRRNAREARKWLNQQIEIFGMPGVGVNEQK